MKNAYTIIKLMLTCVILCLASSVTALAECCGDTEYDPATEGCCDDTTVYELATEGCCKTDVYTITSGPMIEDSFEETMGIAGPVQNLIESLIPDMPTATIDTKSQERTECCNDEIVDYTYKKITINSTTTREASLDGLKKVTARINALGRNIEVSTVNFKVAVTASSNGEGETTFTTTCENAGSVTIKTTISAALSGKLKVRNKRTGVILLELTASGAVSNVNTLTIDLTTGTEVETNDPSGCAKIVGEAVLWGTFELVRWGSC